MSKSKAKTKLNGSVKEWFKERYEKDKILTVSVGIIVAMIIIGIAFKIVNRHFWKFISVEIILTIVLVLVLVLNKKARAMWHKVTMSTKITTVIVPLFLIALTVFIGTLNIADISVVNQLQHHSQTERTNDIFNPIMVHDSVGLLDIEITLDELTYVAGVDTGGAGDSSDVYAWLWQVSNPIASTYDWIIDGTLVDSFILVSDELDSYCDNVSSDGLYYNHFYREWEVAELIEDYTYVLYLEFWDAHGDFNGDEELKAVIEGSDVMGGLPEEEVLEIISACDYVSFFEYRPMPAWGIPEVLVDDTLTVDFIEPILTISFEVDRYEYVNQIVGFFRIDEEIVTDSTGSTIMFGFISNGNGLYDGEFDFKTPLETDVSVSLSVSFDDESGQEESYIIDDLATILPSGNVVTPTPTTIITPLASVPMIIITSIAIATMILVKKKTTKN